MQFLHFLLRVLLILAATEVSTGLVLGVFLPESGWVHEVAHYAVVGLSSAPLLYFWVFRPLAGAVALRRLQEEHQFTLRLLETAAVMVVVMDRDGRIVRFNREAERVSGYTAEEVMGREMWFLIPPHLRDEIRGVLDELASGTYHNRHENPWLTKAGDERLISWSNTTEVGPDGEVVRVIATGVDITERQAALHQLSLFRAGMERSGEVIFLTDLDGTILYVNPTFVEVYGYSREEAVGENPRILKSGKVPEELYEAFWSTLLAGEVLPVQIVNRRKDGSFLDVEGSANPITNEAGEIVAFLAIQRDVTERNRTLEALKASEERFRELLEDTPVAMAAVARDGGIRYVNPALCELVGYAEDELVPRPALDFVHPEDRVWAAPRLARAFGTGKAAGPARFTESRLVHRSGWTIPAEVFASPGELQGEPILLVVLQDLTERRNLEERLRQSMKMEAVGQLAGGVAHDFNNLLTVIQSNTELVVADYFPEAGVPEELTEVEAAVRRGKGLIDRILTFSRKEGLTFSAVDATKLLEGLTPALRRLLPESIQIELVPHADLPAVRAHVGSLEQVIINLATNARDAMVRGGTLSISASPVQPANWEMPGVAFRIRDTGVGMSASVRERIFDPFFTTKPVGIGTGLGLAAVYGLVKQHGGTVVVDSEEDVGTTVTFTVRGTADTPEASSDVGAASGPNSSEGKARRGEVVLVVEDDSALRRAAVRALTRLGYETVEAGNGNEGLERYREHADRIDLVMTDVVMPGMGGPAMARQILSEFPDTRFLFCSGYNSPGGEGETLEAERAFLRKPWNLDELAREVRAALDGGFAQS